MCIFLKFSIAGINGNTTFAAAKTESWFACPYETEIINNLIFKVKEL